MSFAHSPKIVTDGLVLALDAGNTKSYPGTGTTWYDKSGYSNNGTLINGPTFNTGSLGSIVFDGVDDYINCTSLNVDYSATFTANAWFKLSTLNRSNTVIGAGDGQVGPYPYWMITIPSNNYLQFWGYTPVYGNLNISYNTSLTNNLWYYATVTYNSGNSILYLNGNMVASGTVLTSNNPNAKYTRLGYNTWAGGGISNYLNGNISQTSIYNRVLSSQEVLQNFNALRNRFGI